MLRVPQGITVQCFIEICEGCRKLWLLELKGRPHGACMWHFYNLPVYVFYNNALKLTRNIP